MRLLSRSRSGRLVVAGTLLALALPLHAQPRTAPLDSGALASVKVRSLGPFRGGRSTSAAGIPGQPHAFFMGSTGGGVWHTDDADPHHQTAAPPNRCITKPLHHPSSV